MELLLPAVVGFGVLIMAGAVGGTWYYEKKRAEALAAWASDHGFVLDPDAAAFEQQMKPFKLFNKGHSRNVRNLMRSTREGMQLALCDYRYTIPAGKSSHTYVQTVCAISASQAMPPFLCRPQLPFFDAVGKLFGGQDLNFEEDPAFSQAYVLQTDGAEAELRRFFNEPTREAFLRLAAKSLQAETAGGTLLMHYGQRRLSVDQLDGLVADAVNLRRTLMR